MASYRLDRIIPAYAGSTAAHGFASRGRRGSSPHTRGALSAHTESRSTSRIIPAYAGSTGTSATPTGTMPDHPRIRGEHVESGPSRFFPAGSSPHTRGARPSTGRRASPSGIIPAYAGSTIWSPALTCWPTDHPRIRGEHRPGPGKFHLSGGSSPHTRGAPTYANPTGSPPRIIPAYAGSTRSGTRRLISRPDHPRIRGEHTYANMEQESILGSSPHTRGAHPAALPGDQSGRIIPAYAGSTRRN